MKASATLAYIRFLIGTASEAESSGLLESIDWHASQALDACALQEAQARAWDEGFVAQGEMSFDSDGKPMMRVTNPYREAAV